MTAASNAAPRRVLVNATVLPMDRVTPPQQAIALEGNRILGVGTRDDMTAMAGAGADRTDLEGATVLPGLIDTHPHSLHFTAFELGLVNILDARNHDEIVDRIRARAGTTPEGEWIITTPVGDPHYFITRDYHALAEGRLPDRHVLDRAAPNHPVHIQAWAPRTPNVCAFNTLALRRLGIGNLYPDTVCNVTFEKDDAGRPTGIVSGPVNNYYSDDPFWNQLLDRMAVPIPDFLWDMGAAEGIRRNNAMGITGLYEAHAMDRPHIESYQRIRAMGACTMRVASALELSGYAFRPLMASDDEIRANLTVARELQLMDDPFFRVTGATLSRGGPCWPGFLRVYESYRDGFGRQTRGMTFHDRSMEVEACRYCLEHNIRFNMMIGGYRDADEFVQTLEELSREFSDIPERAWVVQHCILTSPAQADAFARWGLHTQTSLSFLYGKAALYAERMGEQVLGDLVAVKRFVDCGCTTALGTDWGPKNIFAHIMLAETRQTACPHRTYGDSHPALAKNAITREQALLGFTADAARSMQWEGIGSLKPGNLADLAILDQNPLEIDAELLPATRALCTMVDGTVVHGALGGAG